MSEPTLYDVAAVRPRDPAWALGPGETYPPAPPLWVCADHACTCAAETPWPDADGGGWRKVWPPAPQARA